MVAVIIVLDLQAANSCQRIVANTNQSHEPVHVSWRTPPNNSPLPHPHRMRSLKVSFSFRILICSVCSIGRYSPTVSSMRMTSYPIPSYSRKALIGRNSSEGTDTLDIEWHKHFSRFVSSKRERHTRHNRFISVRARDKEQVEDILHYSSNNQDMSTITLIIFL